MSEKKSTIEKAVAKKTKPKLEKEKRDPKKPQPPGASTQGGGGGNLPN